MRYFLVAGEASGDLHGAELMGSILAIDAHAEFNYWGGDEMEKTAPGLMKHYKENAIMGFVEVVANIRKISKNLSDCKKAILHFQPDVVILIDYPGFNLRIASFSKRNGLKTVYYIAPKVWAWKENRAKILEKNIDLMLLIFPFEIDYFRKWKVNAHYIGNPLAYKIQAFKSKYASQNQTKSIALLPGSRKQELKRMLPTMVALSDFYPDYEFIICGAPGLEEKDYLPYLSKNIKLVFNQTYQILASAEAAVVCSGTASLETAFFNVPQICAYKANAASLKIAKLFVKVKYMSLVNLCMNKEIVPELLQEKFNMTTLKNQLDQLLIGGADRNKMLEEYAQLQSLFGEIAPTKKAATAILKLAKA